MVTFYCRGIFMCNNVHETNGNITVGSKIAIKNQQVAPSEQLS